MPPESHDALLEDRLARAWAALYGDDPAAALAPLRAALCLAPECGEAWAASAELAAPSLTGELLGRAAACDPGQRRWRLAWGEALLADRPAQAQAVFAAAAAERPDDVVARLGWGRALARLSRHDEALAQHREAAALSGGDAEIARELAALYIVCGDPLAAAETLAPHTGAYRPDPAALTVLAQAWAALGERPKALAALDRAIDLGDAAAAALRQDLAAGDSGETPPPDAAYVRALFDRYAERFDAELMERLDYRGPQLIAAAAAAALPGAGGLRVLDLGCGTGLAGAVLRPLAAELHGVDLSAAMIAQAEKRRLYDRLMVGGLVEALRHEPAAWDLLTAADVLMYLGPLEEAFAAAAAALRPGGVFVFTVEATTRGEAAAGDGDAPFLRPSRRYAHSANYLRRELAAVGLDVAALESATLRMDRRQPVVGYVATALKPR